MPQVEPVIEQLSFVGTGQEYFKIWIVNLALTIVTFGVFSAWAKVRRMQFFYRHTRFAGAGLDYHGEPIALLKGRIVAAVLFALYMSIAHVPLFVALAIVALLVGLLPWLLHRSFRFQLRNTSYRGLRFAFHGQPKSAYWIFLGLPILAVLPMFLLVPLWHHRLKRYQFSNAAYGTTRFSVATSEGEVYGAYLMAAAGAVALMTAVIVIAIGATAGLIGAGFDDLETDPRAPAAMLVVTAVLVLIYIVGIVAVQSVFQARMRNIVWRSVRLGRTGFMSDVRAGRLFWISLTNLLATVLTIGLFRPFAQVRLVRYLAGTLTVVAAGGLDEFAAGTDADVAAIGEEAADLFDFDIAF
jgi:uncharacterized membrane protein YjgN (DUF898 family)